MSELLVHKDLERLEITFERTFAVESDVLWHAWTEPAQLEQWWGPVGWATTVRAFDLRPGGLWLFGMGPIGTEPEVWVRAIFTEVLAGSSVSYVEGFSDEHAADLDPEPNSVTVDFIGAGPGRTRLVLRTRFASASRLESIIERGIVAGWTDGLERLAEHLVGVAR